jgi:hypothetical protein
LQPENFLQRFQKYPLLSQEGIDARGGFFPPPTLISFSYWREEKEEEE